MKASRVNVDVLQVGGAPFLTVTDDGVGLSSKDMYHMFSFGFSEKPETKPTPRGFGFKMASMRLGSDVFVFTRHRTTRRIGIGFFSRTYNEAECTGSFKVPMIFWNPDGTIFTPDVEAGQSLSIMVRYGPFKTPDELFNEVKKLKGRSGVRIVVGGLKKVDNRDELDFVSNMSDILCFVDGRQSSLRDFCVSRFPRLGNTAIFVRDKVISSHSSHFQVDLSKQSQPTSAATSAAAAAATTATTAAAPAAVSPATAVASIKKENYGDEVEPANRRNKKRRVIKMEGAADAVSAPIKRAKK